MQSRSYQMYDFVTLLIILLWRHNGRDGVSNHQPHDCLHNRLFRRRSKKTSKLRVTGLCAGNSPLTDEFPAQMANNAENGSIWWRHHAICMGTLWTTSVFISPWSMIVATEALEVLLRITVSDVEAHLWVVTWWRHQMETFPALLALCAGNSPVPVNSPHKGQWRGSLMFPLIYAWINDWVNNR